MVRTLSLFALSACAVCPPLEERPLLAACVLGDELPEAEDGVRRLRLDGRVAGRGAQLAAPCDGWGLGALDEVALAELPGSWVELRPGPGEATVRVGLWADGMVLPPGGRSDRWSLDVRLEPGGASFVDLREEGGSAVLWLGEAPSVPELQHPEELHVDDGRPVCRREADCGVVKERTLEVEVGGERGELRPHDRLEVTTGSSWWPRDHVVVHGGHDQPTDEACTDEALVRVAWWERVGL